MMKKTTIILFIIISFFNKSIAQDKQKFIGLTSDISLEAPLYSNYIGIQGGIQTSNKGFIQGQITFGDNNFIYLGGDYLLSISSSEKKVNCFLGAGAAYEFSNNISRKDISFNAQFGAQLNLKKIVPYISYKPKFYFEIETFEPSNISIGLKYIINNN